MATRKKPPSTKDIGINIAVDIPTVEEASKSILDILRSPAENETKCVTLYVPRKLFDINSATMVNRSVGTGE